MAGVRLGPGSGPGRRGAEAQLNAIVVRGLTKRYGGVPAVDGLDLSLEQGLLYGFLGPNGAGKTTTIRMVLGLIFPTAGSVEVLGERVHGDHAGAMRRVGAIIEEPAFWSYLSGRRNLEYLARAAGPGPDRAARLARIDETLRTVGLEAAARKKVKAYSQGMRQRLGIAAALLGQPDMLVLDEPTNGLDPQGMREVRVLLRRLADGGTTVFVSSHLLAEVEAMCDRVGVLARGRLVAEGPPSHLRGGGDRIRIDVDDAAMARAVLARLDGVTEEAPPETAGVGARVVAGADVGVGGSVPLSVRLAPPATAAGVNAALVSAGVAVSALQPVHESLEDVFVSLVEGADVPR